MNKALLFPLLLLLLFSCGKKKTEKPLAKLQTAFRIDPNIKHDTVFKFLNTLPETYGFSDKVVPNAKKTSNIYFYQGERLSSYVNKNGVFNNATAYIKDNDSLYIKIGTSDGYTGYGLFLKIKNNRANTTYYTSTDMLFLNAKEPENITLAQDLVLNQSDYELNDSIYGYIDFQSQYIDQRSDTTIVNAKGHFRAKVQEMER